MRLLSRAGNLASDAVGVGVLVGLALVILAGLFVIGAVIYGAFAGWY